jgi:hypothetical protein
MNRQPALRDEIAFLAEIAEKHVDWSLAVDDFQQEWAFRWGFGRRHMLPYRLWAKICSGSYRLNKVDALEETLRGHDAWELPLHELALKVVRESRHSRKPEDVTWRRNALLHQGDGGDPGRRDSPPD